MKRFALSLLLILTAFFSYAQGLTAQIFRDGDLLFGADGKAAITVNVSNNAEKKLGGKVVLKVMTDKYEPVKTYSKNVSVKPSASADVKFEFTLRPGFYRLEASAAGSEPDKCNIGCNAEAVVSAPDQQPDFREFWDRALKELAAVAPEFSIKLIPEHSTPEVAQYEISMKSIGGEVIKAYYTEPVQDGKYPVIINYMGYGSTPYYLGCSTEFCELVLSVRGQAINAAEDRNPYGKWIEYRLDDPEEYYYRGAFMDLVRAIDFVVSRPKVDSRYVFAQGGSQGGAFTFAACALDHRITAACPDVPFLSDYPDYFKIVNWPAWEVFEGQQHYGISDEELYRNLSYFDIKNLAPWVKCPILMAFGLQDETCPPHTNFAAYNNLNVEKDFICYKLSGHDVWRQPTWNEYRLNFFRKFIK